VPGNIVDLSAGDAVPADVQILHCRDLFIDQSTLTGEALPVEKYAAPAPVRIGSSLDLPNIAFMGTSVLSGTAQVVVLATSAHTAFGAVAIAAAAAKAQTGFDRGLQRFIRFMLRVMLLMMLLVFMLNGLIKEDWLQAFQFALAVAVGLAPELLAVVVTVNLAKGALAMAERKCIVKRLSAIQNVGAMVILCTDKTGTLTQNRVILARHIDIDGNDSRAVTELAYLNSHYQTGLQNLLDKAVIEYAHANTLTPTLEYSKIDELRYDFQRRRMSVILQRPEGAALMVCKGAVEEVLSC
jgi:Mg2+-importing ATPase